MKLNSAISHQFIRLTVNGAVNLQVRGGSAGVIESFYGVIKPIPVVRKFVDIRSSGRIGSGTTEVLRGRIASINLAHRLLPLTNIWKWNSQAE
ncbi:hypothetical protein BUALT_Bualt02G0083900 [Buddleja alternifolia]|uniref:Uncharacterized protein n=1 Tax=Buddleja alternifolia TaxID=168488 RepID=A0AAV6XYJ5_9LAMI|nr:hypothetical protein BUALT_Bualt02G0083900 [Buddleja alternifolia]